MAGDTEARGSARPRATSRAGDRRAVLRLHRDGAGRRQRPAQGRQRRGTPDQEQGGEADHAQAREQQRAAQGSAPARRAAPAAREANGWDPTRLAAPCQAGATRRSGAAAAETTGWKCPAAALPARAAPVRIQASPVTKPLRAVEAREGSGMSVLSCGGGLDRSIQSRPGCVDIAPPPSCPLDPRCDAVPTLPRRRRERQNGYGRSNVGAAETVPRGDARA